MKTWIVELATTNFRIVVSIVMAVMAVLVVLVCLVLNRPLQTDIVITLFVFIGSMLGIDVAQFAVKRNTEIVTPPQAMASNTTTTNVTTTDQDAKKP